MRRRVPNYITSKDVLQALSEKHERSFGICSQRRSPWLDNTIYEMPKPCMKYERVRVNATAEDVCVQRPEIKVWHLCALILAVVFLLSIYKFLSEPAKNTSVSVTGDELADK